LLGKGASSFDYYTLLAYGLIEWGKIHVKNADKVEANIPREGKQIVQK